VLDLAAGCGQRIARAGMDAVCRFCEQRAAAAAPPPQRASSTLGWLDDWTPEASGIFRIFRREPSRLPEMAADAGAPVPPVEVPVPRGRLAPAATPSGSVLAFTLED
jgi:hypothetical protein